MTQVFGLTGGVASGKSTVARYFAARGVAVIDADDLAREVVSPGSPALQEIAAAFGAELIDANGELNRRRLGQRVFPNPALREQLNAIVHPRVAALFQQRLTEFTTQGVPLVCYDVPLLFERNLQANLHPVVVVTTPYDLQLARLMTRNGLPSEEAASRIAAQMPLKEKVTQADYVIDNSGTLEETHRQAEAVLHQIQSASDVARKQL